MLEIYPTRLLNAAQVHHILSSWRMKSSFTKRLAVRDNGVHYALTSVFFRSCVPRQLHEAVFEQGKRHFRSSMLKFAYNICEIVPGAPHGPWLTDRRFRCIVPLTSFDTKHGYTAFRNHPEITVLKPGRLVAVCGNETYRELGNDGSTSRIFLYVHVYLNKDEKTTVPYRESKHAPHRP